jgi:hypothetical protein
MARLVRMLLANCLLAIGDTAFALAKAVAPGKVKRLRHNEH